MFSGLEERLSIFYKLYGRHYIHIGIPDDMYYIVLSVLVAGCLIIFVHGKDKNTIIQRLSLLTLGLFVTLLYSSTVIYRDGSNETGVKWIPFWSYIAIMEGKSQLFLENLLNIIVFIPVGILGAFAFPKQPFSKLIILAITISFFIEFSQFYYRKGLAEFDDVIHNTIGCLIGYFSVLRIVRKVD